MWKLIAAVFAAAAITGAVIFCTGAAGPPPPPPPPPPYPGRRPPPYPPPPAAVPLSAAAQATQAQCLADLALPHNDANSVWDQAIIPLGSPLRTALDGYVAGNRGASVANLNLALSAGNPAALHNDLVARGFQFRREPLKAGVDPNTGAPLYLKVDGTTTANAADPAVVPHDLYTHNDGGIVRVKPEGVPGGESPRPQPHAVKAVLYTPHQDTGFDDEAFKVTNAGQPVPKIFTSQAGMRQTRPPLSKAQVKKTYLDTVMIQAHTDI